jgi:phosphogluconate dehydratase
MSKLHPVVAAVTARIVERSRPGRIAYLDLIKRAREAGLNRTALSCGNLAHGFAASGDDKAAIRGGKAMNIGIITAYNDMLSAHQPYGRYPEQIKLFAREMGATAQVAGGVPAMCDGVTQGQDSMELSLFSRDNIAMAAAVGLSHSMFEAVMLLGLCDKIVPGLVIGALRFGHLPAILIPAGPMPSGRPSIIRRGQSGPRGIAGGRGGILSRCGYMYVFWYGQFEPDDDGDDGPAHAGIKLR